MLSRIRRKNSINSQSAFCTDLIGIAVFVRASLKSGPKYTELEKKNSSETVLAAMIDMWTACWEAHEEKYNDYFTPTEDERKCAAY